MTTVVEVNVQDIVRAAYMNYKADGGDKTFAEFHNSTECPKHPFCNFCDHGKPLERVR